MSTIITQNPYTFTVSDNMNINAVFEALSIILSATANNPTTITLKNYNGDTYSLNLTSGSNEIYDDSISGFSGNDIKTVYYTTSSSPATNTDLTTLDLSGCRNITSLVNYAFKNCTALTSITLPSLLTSIGSSAFHSSGLTSITLPSSLTSIGSSAFHNCTSLTTLTLPEGLTTIEVGAFRGCSGLTSITLPSRLTTINQYAFFGCTGLTSITLPSGLTTIGNETFEWCSGLNSFTIPSSVSSVGGSAFASTAWWNNQTDNSVIYKDNICLGYKGTISNTITINSGTRLIAATAFRNCTSLTTLILPSSLTSIGSGAFYNCSNLNSITFSEGLTYIDENAFRKCTSLTTLTIPSTVSKLGISAFDGCTNLTSITVLATTPPDLFGFYGGSTTFPNTVYVPAVSVDAYKAASGWSRFADRIQAIP